VKAFYHCVICACLIVVAGLAAAQDVASGPESGSKVQELKVYDATGAHKEKEVDYAADRKHKPTIYLFINAEKFDRPMNRFMKTLDSAVKKDFEGAYVVAVWVGGEPDKVKELLTRVQQSVQYEATALTLSTGDKEGPKGWGVNADARLTAVVATKGKVAAQFGYQSVNETDVPKVKEALEKAIQAKE
jgi:hypothetical protein